MDTSTYFEEKLLSLPDQIRWAIQAVDYKAALNEIKAKYRLHIDQSAVLESLCERFMLGDIDAPLFVNNMFSEGHVSSQIASDILIDIDTLILKKIKEHLELLEREEEELEQKHIENLEDDEREIREIDTAYKKQDEEYIKISEEVEKELKNEGYLEDGSNITDEDIAKAYKMSPAEFLEWNRNSTNKATDRVEIPLDIKAEKESLLKELESPQKSFTKPLFVNKPIEKIQPKETPITPDHQLQNTHIEEPITIQPTITQQEQPSIKQKPSPSQPVIKKPIQVEIKKDIYREPIE